MNHRDFDDDEKKNPNEGLAFEFECPECNATNPYPDGFASGSEIQCYYCGQEFKAVRGDGRWKFKPV